MKAIASYYIKTLFLWKIDETKEKKYWQKGLSTLFRIMVQELHDAIKDKNICYFWNKDNNLIANLKPTIQKIYVHKLNEVLKAIDSNDVDKVVSFLLCTDDFQQFKQSEFYKKQQAGGSNTPSPTIQINSNHPLNRSQDVVDSPPFFSQSEASLSETDSVSNQTLNTKLDIIIKKLEKLDAEFKTEKKKLKAQIDVLMDKISAQNDKLIQLEMMHSKDKTINVETGLEDENILEITANEIRLKSKETKII